MRWPIFLISCSLFNLHEIIPKLKDKINKDKVDVKKWKITALYNFIPTAINKKLNWVDAIYNNNLFKLYDRINKIKKMKEKIDPSIKITFK